MLRYALLAKTQGSTGLLLQRLIRFTECRKNDDEGFRIPWFLSRKSWQLHTSKNKFRQISEHTEPKVN